MAISDERLLFRPNSSGPVSVCLAYPNTWAVGMANLGYQAVYRLLATTPGVVCERVFLPEDGEDARGADSRSPDRQRSGDRPRSGDRQSSMDRPSSMERLRTIETGRSPAEFDVLAFSLSFESDYPNSVRLLDACGIPARAADRRADSRGWPLLLAGGPATFLNPEPVAPFFDIFLIGEAEEMLPEAFAGAESWASLDRERILGELARVEGAYVPELHEEEYGDDGWLARRTTQAGALAVVRRRYVANLDAFPTATSVVAPGAVFGDYFLVEASRGCEWGCRFCAAGFMYRPVRHRSAESLTQQALEGLRESSAATVGLVGAEMASHPAIASTCERIAAAGGRPSPSSLKADQVSPRLAAAVAGSGTRSVTVAPEAGSERMRRVINKNLTEAEILRAADLMVGDGVESLKLYFMCALPTETDADLDGICELSGRIRDRMMGHGRARGRVGRITVSLNPFVPKPWTPFQWDPMVPVGVAQAKIAYIRRRVGRMPNVDLDADSPREAYMQTLLSRGDRRVASVIEALARSDRGWWQELGEIRRGTHPTVTLDIDAFVHRELDETAPLPWDFIDHRIDKAYLRLERRRALAERETEPCDVATCHTCGAC